MKTKLWVLCTLTHGKAMSWGWLLWGMLWKVGLKEQLERKNKSKVTQELVEKNNNKEKKEKEKKRVTYTNEGKKKKTTKVKEYEKLGKIKW